jgi:cell division protein FtsQ
MMPRPPLDPAAISPSVEPTAKPLPPGVIRRRELRQQRRAERLRNGWRLLVFSGLSAGLGLVLLRQGWILRDSSLVEVSGSRLISREQVIQAGQLQFPLPLLELRPRQLAAQLATVLPVEQVRVSRLILPARLRIELADRQAIARAERRLRQGSEQGFIDRFGYWISRQQSTGIRLTPGSNLVVLGWQERHRAALSLVLDHRAALGPGLRQIRFDADGSLWLTTTELGPLRLGPADGRLERRLEVAAHLNRVLPQQMGGRLPRMTDLSDPEQPELSLADAVAEPANTGRAAARKPFKPL